MNNQMQSLKHILISLLSENALHALKEETQIARFLNYFLALLDDTTPSLTGEIDSHAKHITQFLESAVDTIKKELIHTPEASDLFAQIASSVTTQIATMPEQTQRLVQSQLWRALDTESAMFDNVNKTEECINTIKNSRTITITKINETPISNPADEILFTSNVLLTIPEQNTIDSLPLPKHIKETLHHICEHESQAYWYDHPMPIGIKPESNEMLYGLRGLSDTVLAEKKLGTIPQEATVKVLLSVSVTHTGLADIIQEYLQYELQQAGAFPGLEVYIVTEPVTERIAHLMQHTLTDNNHTDAIARVFGVDGRYGRHYSFLKAIAAVWNVCVDSTVRATFKIDLDQVFPNKDLAEQSGKSAFEHFTSPLWGAEGLDSTQTPVLLGMIAGALVNEHDIDKGLFTPDVNFPPMPLQGEDLFFPRTYMMALSTRAEMMTRYEIDGSFDGVNTCIQRVHVTGGTNGILVSSLRKYRPFTPSFIGRAEDQAYIMSVYHADSTPRLRYVHASGLIMRHDKASFASDAIKAAKLGTYAGDLLRTILFSYYAMCLPGGISAFKKDFAPFTSCFSSKLPVTAAIGRLFLHVAEMTGGGFPDASLVQLEIAAYALHQVIQDGTDAVQTTYQNERNAWNMFYDALDTIEHTNAHANTAQEIAAIIQSCKVL